MKIRITHKNWEDAMRIELHLTISYEDGSWYVESRYIDKVMQLASEGFVSVVSK